MRITYFLNFLGIHCIRIYQIITKNKKHKCLFYPTCSNYAIIAFQKYDFITALRKILMRLRDCNPFSTRKFIDYP